MQFTYIFYLIHPVGKVEKNTADKRQRQIKPSLVSGKNPLITLEKEDRREPIQCNQERSPHTNQVHVHRYR